MAAPAMQLSQNALTRQDPAEVMARREVTSSYNHVYSCQLDEHKATSQKASGRCW